RTATALRKFEFPITQSLAFVDGFVEITPRNRFQPVALFDVTGGNQLAGEECVEQTSNIDAEVVFDEFGIELRVVRDLDWTRRSEHLAQRRERFASFHVLLETVNVNDAHAVRRGE